MLWGSQKKAQPKPVEKPVIAGQPLFNLFNKLAMMPHQTDGHAIQVIGARAGVGTSTIARALAEFTAVNVDGSVVLVDADPFDRAQIRLSAIDLPQSLHDAQRGLASLEAVLRPMAQPRLFLASLTPSMVRGRSPVLPSLSINAMEEIVAQLRSRFQWIIFDSAPPYELAFAHVLSRFVDGTIIVVESEKSRLPVVQQLIHQIKVNGGTPLGLVINKRRLLISKFIYKFF
jgi:Mrp family chromosome partitioning ATPase